MTGFRYAKPLIFIALASLAASQQVTGPAGVHLDHYDGLLAMCPGALWAGDDACQTLRWKSGVCYIVPASLNDQVQSAKPLYKATATCVLYHDHGCQGEGTPPITCQGIENFETSGLYSPFRSWRCECGASYAIKIPP